MTWKVINIGDSGTASKFGGDDTDKISKLFSGIDVDDVDINANWKFRNGILEVSNPANTFKYSIFGSAISADRSLTLPPTTGSDVLAALNLDQTWTQPQTFQKNVEDLFTLYRNSNIGTDAKIGINFDTRNNSSVRKTFAKIQGYTENTGDGTEYGAISGDAMVGGTSQNVFFVDYQNLYFGDGNNNQGNFDLTGQTAPHSWTLPNTSVQLLGTTSSQTVTSKTFDIKDNTFAHRSWTVIVFKSGSTYYARKHDGTLTSSSSTAETVLAAAIALGGNVFISAGQYDLSGAFAGFTLPADCHIYLEKGCQIRVPDGYTSYVFRINDTGFGNVIEGSGFITEQGTPDKNWKGIRLNSTGSPGVSFCKIKDLYLHQPGTGIEIISTGASAFVTSNVFENIIIDGPRIAVDFQNGGSGAETSGNIFKSILIEKAVGVTTDGFKNVDGTHNSFTDCFCYDFDATANECNIKSTATGTNIQGGRMTGYKGTFRDNGVRTIIVDSGRRNNSTFFMRPSTGKFGAWYGVASTAADGLLNARLTQGTVGTGSASSTLDSTGQYTTFATGATINSIMAHRITGLRPLRGDLGAYFKAALYLNNNTNMRVFCGLVDSVSTPASASDPLNAVNGIALWFDSAVSADWKIKHNDGSGASVTAAIGGGVAASTAVLYPVEIFYNNNTSKWRFVFNDIVTEVGTSDIPAATQNLGFWTYIENTTGADRTMRVYYEEIYSDK